MREQGRYKEVYSMRARERERERERGMIEVRILR